jgi:hypothetical protein
MNRNHEAYFLIAQIYSPIAIISFSQEPTI